MTYLHFSYKTIIENTGGTVFGDMIFKSDKPHSILSELREYVLNAIKDKYKDFKVSEITITSLTFLTKSQYNKLKTK